MSRSLTLALRRAPPSLPSIQDKLVNELEKELNVEDQEKRQLVTEKEQLQVRFGA